MPGLRLSARGRGTVRAPLNELVLRREGDDDEFVSMGADNLYSGMEFNRDGIESVVKTDNGPPQQFTDGQHVARVVCEPKGS